MFENYLYATNSDNANMQPKTSVIRVNRFNSSDFQVVTRVDKGGALHVYHQRRQPAGTTVRFSFKFLNVKFSKCSCILIVRPLDSVLFIVVSPLVPYVKIRFLCLKSVVTLVLRISLGSQAAAPISACWVTVTRAEPAAAVLVLPWAVTENPARVSKISIQPAQTSFKQCYTTAFSIVGLSCI